MPKPAIVVHGGAGAGPERLSNLQPAIEAARRVFDSGGDAIEAAVEACVILEDDPVFNAGTGSVMRNDGTVLTDASLQVSDGRMGFVAVMENTPNPIRICVDLLNEEINGLAGPGARTYADKLGHPNTPVVGRPPKGKKGDVGELGGQMPELDTDTVGAIARDSSGLIAAATSTGGTSYRPAGRVGDVPLPGCGFWVEEGLGVAATGVGEAITTALLSYKVHQQIMANDILSPEKLQSGMLWGIEQLIKPNTSVGMISLASNGAGEGAANTDMPWATWSSES
ncbi:MAG: hypothetical protein CMA50_01010 [Euryarchaeota archaeon]|nr:hypothetical protein [Euryarchaeota archaeon]|tara:strand:- start:1158 stop:2003 length:846 start_codon:yes stop_codon:yes gene_type:complete